MRSSFYVTKHLLAESYVKSKHQSTHSHVASYCMDIDLKQTGSTSFNADRKYQI
jgi:hypothetical protein